MIVQTIKVNDCAPQTIVIGRRGTYNTLQIAFDLSYLVESYGNGVAVLAVKRSQDESAYPAVTSQEDDLLLWTVSETDTFYVGAGEAQLMWYVDGGLAKTIIYPMVVMRDILATSEEAPDAYQTWVDDLIAEGAETLQNAQDAEQSASDAEQAKDDAVAAKEAAENAKEDAEAAQQAAETAVTHYPKIVNSYWYVWTNGEWVNTGVKAEGVDGRGIVSVTGQKTSTVGNVDTYTMTVAYTSGNPDTFTFTVTNGLDGYSPVVTITAITGGHRVTITDETHPTGQSFDVMDGEDSAVLSVAGKTGNVTLNANDVAFSESGTYDEGTVGAELLQQKNAIDKKAPLIINTASGDVASFADGADGMQIRKIVGTIVPVQSGTGDPSPDNVRPISGWTQAVVTRTGRNLLKTAGLTYAEPSNTSFGNTTKRTYQPNTYTTKLSANNNYNSAVTITNISITDNSVIFTSTSTGYGVSIPTIGLKAEENYTFSVESTTVKLFASFYAADGTFISSLQAASVQPAKVTFTVPEGTYYTCLGFNVLENGSTVSATNIQLELGESVSAYEAYKPIQTLPINWQTEAGTIYGGTVTLNEDGSADVVATWAIVDLGTLTYDVDNAASGIYRASLPLMVQGNAQPNVLYCSHYPYSGIYAAATVVTNMTDKSIGKRNGSYKELYVRDTSYLDYTSAQFAEVMSGVQVLYPLTDAQSWHISNVGSLSTYLGTNNVWIDTGAITECDYPADTKLYVDGLTAPDEDMIANANIASGKYFTVNNQLYLSTAQIAAGAQIIPGSNCTATSITEALNALNT